MLIRDYPVAQKLYIKYCKIFRPEDVRNIYEQEDDFESQAALFIKESYTAQAERVSFELSFSYKCLGFLILMNFFIKEFCRAYIFIGVWTGNVQKSEK